RQKKVSTRAADLEKSSRRLELADEVQPPCRIERCQPVFFLQAGIPESLIGGANIGCGFFAGMGSKRQCRSATSDVAEAASQALDKRTIERARIEDKSGI